MNLPEKSLNATIPRNRRSPSAGDDAVHQFSGQREG